MDAELTLEKAKKAVQQKEAIHGQQSVLNRDPTCSPVDTVKNGSSQGQSQTFRQLRPQRCNSQPQQNTALDVEKAHTAETSAPHENQSVTSAIAKNTIAPSACQKPSPQL